MNELEPKYGWGCADNHIYNQALAVQIAELEINNSWSTAEVIAYIAKLVKEL